MVAQVTQSWGKMTKTKALGSAKPGLPSKLLRAEGGSINPEALRKKGLLLAVENRGEYLYPLWQFEKAVFPHLKTILKELEVKDAAKIAFFLTPNVRLKNMTPLQALRKGWLGRVAMAARNFVEDSEL